MTTTPTDVPTATVQAAMRRDDPLPAAAMVRLTVGGVCVAAAVCAVLIAA